VCGAVNDPVTGETLDGGKRRRRGERVVRALGIPNGEPADPALSKTATPDWRVGDEFLAAGLRRFLILAIEPEMNDDAASPGNRSRRSVPKRAVGPARALEPGSCAG
jgi:hypothetical protein